MRKLVVSEFVSLDNVMQAPGGAEEDTEGGFTQGGWTGPFRHDAIGAHFFREMSHIDEYSLLVYPIVLGSGKKLFPEGLHATLRLLESRPFPSGVVLMRYARA